MIKRLSDQGPEQPGINHRAHASSSLFEGFLQSRDQYDQAYDGIDETQQQDKDDDDQYIDSREDSALRPFAGDQHDIAKANDFKNM